MKNHFQFVNIQLGKLEFFGSLKRLLGAGIHALRAKYTLGKIDLAIKLLWRDLAYSDSVRRAILHAHFASYAFLRIKLEFSPETLGHPGLIMRIILSSGFLKN
jgi:hypothetical protein